MTLERETVLYQMPIQQHGLGSGTALETLCNISLFLKNTAWDVFTSNSLKERREGKKRGKQRRVSTNTFIPAKWTNIVGGMEKELFAFDFGRPHGKDVD